MNENAAVAVIGAGPAGLIAADVLSAAGKRVAVFERMPSVARKFLIAGRGGLNLTHSEPFERFIQRYGDAAPQLAPMLRAFTPSDLIAWAEGLGQETFVGSSGRVFPKAMKASPLLRALLRRLADRGVAIHTSATWLGWDESGALRFAHGGPPPFRASATLLTLGGASWPRLGSNGLWAEALRERGVEVAPFRPANVGFNVAWSEHFRDRFAGQPLKTIALRCGAHAVRGEAMVTRYGLEGGALYALSAELRARAPVTIHIDLKPALTKAGIEAKLGKAKPGDSLSSTLRKALGLSPLAVGLLHEAGPPPREAAALAALIKAVPVRLIAAQGLERAISSAGGIAWSAVDEDLQLRALPGVYVAGEMLDWEAPTGGYLLQASFATGVWAAHAILSR
ncbi:MAG: TIGR03862 family flavoprotein [Hyphomonadaceae bacterium]|nr:TIGR03862 family flavoprotein [Hyphomonadaceae bacterium]